MMGDQDDHRPDYVVPANPLTYMQDWHISKYCYDFYSVAVESKILCLTAVWIEFHPQSIYIGRDELDSDQSCRVCWCSCYQRLLGP